MTQLENMVRLAHQLPFPWAGAAIAVIVIMCSVAYVAWRQGSRDLRALFINWPVVVMAAISAAGLLAYYRYWGLPAAFSDGQIGIVVSEIAGDI
jgi:hypothetical protein